MNNSKESDDKNSENVIISNDERQSINDHSPSEENDEPSPVDNEQDESKSSSINEERQSVCECSIDNPSNVSLSISTFDIYNDVVSTYNTDSEYSLRSEIASDHASSGTTESVPSEICSNCSYKCESDSEATDSSVASEKRDLSVAEIPTEHESDTSEKQTIHDTPNVNDNCEFDGENKSDVENKDSYESDAKQPEVNIIATDIDIEGIGMSSPPRVDMQTNLSDVETIDVENKSIEVDLNHVEDCSVDSYVGEYVDFSKLLKESISRTSMTSSMDVEFGSTVSDDKTKRKLADISDDCENMCKKSKINKEVEENVNEIESTGENDWLKIELTQEENVIVKRLSSQGFDIEHCVVAFVVSGKDEQKAKDVLENGSMLN